MGLAGLLQLPSDFAYPKLKLKGFQHMKNTHGKWGLIPVISVQWEPWATPAHSQSFPG